MQFSDFLAPASSESPCGPDLDMAGDNDYFNYMIPAEGRLPERFVEPDTGKLFDRNTIDLEQEISSISSLLARSRDIRLFALQAQFCALAGDFPRFVDCTAVLEALLKQNWNDVHPMAVDGDLTARKTALEALADRVKVLAPLTYLTIVEAKSIGAISWRQCQVALKPELARSFEKRLDAALVRSAFADRLNEPRVASFHESATRCRDHLKAIVLQFIVNDAAEFAPGLEGTINLLSDVANFTGEFVRQPDDVVTSPKGLGSQTIGQSQASGGVEQASSPSLGSSVSSAAGPNATPVRSQGEAKDALTAIENYFLQSEPSTPALLLVHQARLLIGAPIVEALAALAPGRVETATLMIDQTSGFSFDMSKMRELSVPNVTHETGGLFKRPAAQSHVVGTRPEALALMLGVEAFLSATEPSSPVPLLLLRAREFMEKSFSSIILEMFGQAEPKK